MKPTDTKEQKKLALSKETLRNLKIKTQIKGGMGTLRCVYGSGASCCDAGTCVTN